MKLLLKWSGHYSFYTVNFISTIFFSLPFLPLHKISLHMCVRYISIYNVMKVMALLVFFMILYETHMDGFQLNIMFHCGKQKLFSEGKKKRSERRKSNNINIHLACGLLLYTLYIHPSIH